MRPFHHLKISKVYATTTEYYEFEKSNDYYTEVRIMKKKRFNNIGKGFVLPTTKSEKRDIKKLIDRVFSYIYEGGA